MAIKYDVYKNPTVDEDGEYTYHVRLLSADTISTDKLASEIEFGTSMSEGDVKSVFASLEHLFARYLLEGKRIHIDGIGYFQLSVKSPKVKNPDKMRADYISVRTIRFVPEKKLKAKLKKAHFERAKSGTHSVIITIEDIKTLLGDYFRNHSFITRAQFQKLCGLTRGTAQNRLKTLIQEGVLKYSGKEGVHIYFPVSSEDKKI